MLIYCSLREAVRAAYSHAHDPIMLVYCNNGNDQGWGICAENGLWAHKNLSFFVKNGYTPEIKFISRDAVPIMLNGLTDMSLEILTMWKERVEEG